MAGYNIRTFPLRFSPFLGNDEREQTVNQLLTEMDGFEGNKATALIAAGGGKTLEILFFFPQKKHSGKHTKNFGKIQHFS
jgi:hypothetical protein